MKLIVKPCTFHIFIYTPQALTTEKIVDFGNVLALQKKLKNVDFHTTFANQV